MQDFAGRTLAVGDIVSYTENGHPRLYLGRIFGMTKMSVRVQKLSEATTKPGYQRAVTGHTKDPAKVTLVANDLHHLEDGEVWLHFERLRGER